MIIRSLSHHWPARKVEWLMSGLLICWGLYVLFHPEIFTDDATSAQFSGLLFLSSVFTEYPALFWGYIAFGTGVARAIALFINGAMTRTPLVRLIAAFVSMFLITWIVIGLWYSGLPNPDLIVYAWLVVADLLSAYRAAVDVVYAEKQRHDTREASRVVSNKHRFAA